MDFNDIQNVSTSYYHFGSRENLFSQSHFAVKVTLRRVTNDNNHSQIIEKVIRWQEKILGPKDVVNQSMNPVERWTSSYPKKRVGDISLNHDGPSDDRGTFLLLPIIFFSILKRIVV